MKNVKLRNSILYYFTKQMWHCSWAHLPVVLTSIEAQDFLLDHGVHVASSLLSVKNITHKKIPFQYVKLLYYIYTKLKNLWVSGDPIDIPTISNSLIKKLKRTAEQVWFITFILYCTDVIGNIVDTVMWMVLKAIHSFMPKLLCVKFVNMVRSLLPRAHVCVDGHTVICSVAKLLFTNFSTVE